MIIKRQTRTNSPELARFIETMLTSDDPTLRTGLAAHPDCPVEMLSQLKDDPDTDVVISVARHFRCPETTLVELGTCQTAIVRQAVAENPRCPPSLLDRMYDLSLGFPELHYAVAQNPSCPVSLQQRIAYAPPEHLELMRHLSQTSLDAAALHFTNYQTRIQTKLARNPNIEPDVARILFARCSDARLPLVGNMCCPPDILIRVLTGPNTAIRRVAEHNTAIPQHVRALSRLTVG